MATASKAGGRAVRFLLLLGAAAAVAWAVWRFGAAKPVSVVLAAVDVGRVERTVANTRAGTVTACRRARLAPSVGGQMVRLHVREGQRVEEGEVLLELWNEDLSAALRLAEREAEAALSRAAEACATAEVAERDAARAEKLLGAGVGTEELAERTRGTAAARRAACTAAQAGARAGAARVEEAQAALQRTRLRAPFAGTVAEVSGEVGEFVTPSPLGVPTLPAVDLIDDRCVYVTAPIDEVDAPAVRLGLPVRVSLDAFPSRRFEGRVSRIAPYVLELEKQARTVDVEVEFRDPAVVRELLPGYSADAEVVLDARDGALRVPTGAVLEGHRVLVFRPVEGEEGVLDERVFVPGLSNWEFTEAASGLAQGERVVLSVDREGVRPGARAVAEPPGGGP